MGRMGIGLCCFIAAMLSLPGCLTVETPKKPPRPPGEEFLLPPDKEAYNMPPNYPEDKSQNGLRARLGGTGGAGAMPGMGGMGGTGGGLGGAGSLNGPGSMGGGYAGGRPY